MNDTNSQSRCVIQTMLFKEPHQPQSRNTPKPGGGKYVGAELD